MLGFTKAQENLSPPLRNLTQLPQTSFWIHFADGKTTFTHILQAETWWPAVHSCLQQHQECSSTKSEELHEGCMNMKPIKAYQCACQMWHLTRQTRDLSPLVLLCWPPLQSWAPSGQGCQVTFGSTSLLPFCGCRSGQRSCRLPMHMWQADLQCLLNSSLGGQWWDSWSLWNLSLQLPPHNLTHSWAHPQACPQSSRPCAPTICRKTFSPQKPQNHNKSESENTCPFLIITLGSFLT